MTDFDLDEPLSCEVVAETVGARRSLIVRLARQGLIETLRAEQTNHFCPGAPWFSFAACNVCGVT